MTPADVSAPTVQEPATVLGGQAPALRHLEIEEASNRYVVHRISLAILPYLIRAGVSPNCVSCMGALSGLAAAWSYYHHGSPWACLLGLAFMVGWHIFDGADGQLARQTGQESRAGFVIDGACDYLTFIFVYGALGFSLSSDVGPSVWLLVAAAALSHAVQAAAFEMQRETYIAWVSSRSHKFRRDGQEDPQSGLTGFLSNLYRAVQTPFRPVSATFEKRLLSGGILRQRTDISEAYGRAFRHTVLAWSILSANNRTIAIFIFCLSGWPLLYFIYEFVVLNLVLVALVFGNHASQRAFVRSVS